MRDPEGRNEEERFEEAREALREPAAGGMATRPERAAERAAEREKAAQSSGAGAIATGAVAGAAAGALATGIVGFVGAPVGALLGALGATSTGAADLDANAAALYPADFDAHYRALWETRLERPADQTFDDVRPAYQYGHLAAQQPAFAEQDFGDVAPELRRRWPDDLARRVGAWDAVRPYVEEAYSYARSRGLGLRRDPTVIGTAGSAVDPVVRDRARAIRADEYVADREVVDGRVVRDDVVVDREPPVA